MRKVTLAAVLLAFGVGTASAAPDPTPPFELRGSDTLFDFTNHVLDACGIPATTTDYFGGGSSLGAGEMRAGNQQISPMSRFLTSTSSECNFVATNAGQGCKVALDGMSALADDADASDCDSLRSSGSMEVLDLNGIPGVGNGVATAGADGACPSCSDATHYTFSDWRDVLRIVYGGEHAHISADACAESDPSRSAIADRFCNSDVRHTLVNQWGNLFEEGATCGATDPDACTELKHAFRRDDVSGTTDTFLTLLALPALTTGSRPSIATQRSFCNGTEVEDNDPIRRVCSGEGNTNGEQACQSVPFALRGTLGTSGWPGGPTTNPADDDHADLGLVLPIVIPPTTPYQDDRFCSTATFGGGPFGFVPMPFATGAAARCPDGLNRVGGQCRWPGVRNASNVIEYGCVNRKDNVHGTASINNIDGRVYNLIARNADGTMKTVPRVNPNTDVESQVGVTLASYRIHQTRVVSGGSATSATVGCKQADATDQIGCLVAASPCSIGYAGLGGDTAISKSLALRAPLASAGYILPDATTVRRLNDPKGAGCGAAGDYDIRYPLSRALWVNSLKGFGTDFSNIANIVDSSDADTDPDFTTLEQDVAECMCDRFYADNAATAVGFIPVTADTCASPGLGGVCAPQIRTCP